MESNSSATSTSNRSNMNSDGGTLILRQSGNHLSIGFPFTIKVGQVFTGFGVGCGLGIGVGTPFNFGAIPMLNQVMSAASGATHAFSGIGRHVNQSLKKMGAKNIQAGIGCGIGFGHGFGAGLALKPGVTQQIQMFILGAVSKVMMKFGGAPNLSINQGLLPPSLQSSMTTVQGYAQNPVGSIAQFGNKVPPMNQDGKVTTGIENFRSENMPSNLTLDARVEKLVNGFLQDPVLRAKSAEARGTDEQLDSETRMLRMVLKHQQVIEELIEENEKLRRVLLEDLKVSADKLRNARNFGTNVSPCSDCFNCRRKLRKK